MAYNTNNPVGSTDPRDLYDNAGNLDKFVNGDAPFYADRLGQQRKSWSGMEADFASAQEGREAAFATAQADREASFDNFLESSAFIWIGDYGPGLIFTSRSQYLVRDGYAYRLSTGTSLPYATTGNWGLEQTNFSLVNQDDLLRQDLSENSGALLVGYGSESLATAVGETAPYKLNSISDLPAAGLVEGMHCQIGGTVYLISGTQSPDVKYPSIPAGTGLYAIPRRGHVLTKVGTQVSCGKVAAAHFSTRSMQGCVIDNRNSRIFFSATDGASPLEKTSFYEYEFNGGVIGSLVASAADIPAGHGDNFAIEILPSGDLYIWFGRSKTTTYGEMDICRLLWAPGANAEDVEVVVPHNSYAAISWYDHESFLIISGTNTADVCLLGDLKAGIYEPIKRLAEAEWVGLVAPTYFPQSVRRFGDYWFGLSGYDTEDAGAYASVANDVAAISRMGFTAAANTDSELQAIAWHWDAENGKFRNIVAVKAQSASEVELLEISDPSVRKNLALPVDGTTEFTDRVTSSQRRGKISPEIQLFKGGIYVGGVPMPGVNFDYRDFRVEQWRKDAGRLQHRFMHWDVMSLVVDGPGDTSFEQGWRFNLLSGDRVHIHKDGMQIGGASVASDSNRGKYTLRVIGGWGAASGGAPAVQVVSNVAGVVSTADVDFAVPDGGRLQELSATRSLN